MDSPIQLDQLVLTANSRLSRWLLLQYSQTQIQNNLSIWETPNIFSIDHWLNETWVQSWPDNYQISNHQSLKLWERIIKNESKNKKWDLLHLRGAAQLAAQAYSLIIKYRVPESKVDFEYTEETKAFWHWKSNYEFQLRNLKAVEPATLMDLIKQDMEHGKISIPKKICFAGFDEITPQLQDWINYLISKNVIVNYYPSQPDLKIKANTNLNPLSKRTIQNFDTQKQECNQCARWVRSIYRPGKTIGIVVPDLAKYEIDIKVEFRSELFPKMVFPWEKGELPFNISLGTSLSKEPMIQIAVLLISLDQETIPFNSLYSILTSTYIKGSNEFTLKVNIDKKLRKERRLIISLKSLQKEFFELPSKSQQVFESITSWIGNKGFNLPSVWAQNFSDLLKGLGWPYGDNSENFDNIALLDAWKNCLEELSSLDSIESKIPRNRAVSILKIIIEEKIYQTKSLEESIQILGILESTGMTFDYLWVMGLHADTLPTTPYPNPFIPFHLQKSRDLPHSSPEREQRYSEEMLTRLLKSSPNVVLSYPIWDADTQLRISPLIADLETNNSFPQTLKSHKLINKLIKQDETIWEKDIPNIPLSDEEKKNLRGGHSILKDQAKCPFRAFAIHRLKINSREMPMVDADSLMRGNLVHKLLENFWREVKSSEALYKLNQSNILNSKIERIVEKTINEKTHLTNQTFFSELERDRLISLLDEWLILELQREPFTAKHLENRTKINLKGLEFNLQIDRVDQTDTGKNILIDYKTGNPKTDWYHTRIQEPQIPLYTLTSEIKPDAVCFATVNKGKNKFLGISKSKTLIPGLDTFKYTKHIGHDTWENLLKTWEANLNQLTENFINGNYEIDPWNLNQTCRNCHLSSFCRINELGNIDDSEEETH